MANNLRGEVDVELNGNIYTMRPTFQALAEIEHAIGKSLIVLLNDFEERGILITEQIKIIYYGVKAGGHILSESEIGEIICRQGITRSLEIVLRFLYNALAVEEIIC